MRFTLTSVCLMLCLALACSVFAADVITGKWSGERGPNPMERNPVTADLKYDGRNLTGTFNPGPNPATISKGTFNEKTGAVHLEAEAKGRGSETVHYVIDGKLEKNKITGKWTYENGAGDFTISKQ